MVGRRAWLAAAGVIVLVVGGAALAWACTPQALVTVAPRSGPAGSTATVEGSAFHSGSVSIRWGSSSGPELAATTGPRFSVAITIPHEAEARVHYIVAVAVGTSYSATDAFEVERAGGDDERSGGSASGSASGGEGGGPGPGRASGGDATAGTGGTTGTFAGGDGGGRTEPQRGPGPGVDRERPGATAAAVAGRAEGGDAVRTAAGGSHATHDRRGGGVERTPATSSSELSAFDDPSLDGRYGTILPSLAGPAPAPAGGRARAGLALVAAGTALLVAAAGLTRTRRRV